jgi:hypothetical protein
MTRLMMTFRTALIAGAGAATLMLLPAVANAEQCRHTVDEDGDPVVMCGSVAYYSDGQNATDTTDDGDTSDTEDQGTLFVDPEDCVPGKYYMMEMADDDFSVPVKCR